MTAERDEMDVAMTAGIDDHDWSPYIPQGRRSTVIDESCCNARIALIQEGGAHVVVARRGPHTRREEETARGSGERAREVFRQLLDAHLKGQRRHIP